MFEEVPLEKRRTGNSFTRLSLYIALPLAVLTAVWITAGRSLFGAGGDLVGIFAISFGPLLFLILGLAAFFSFKDAKLNGGSRAGFPPSVAVTQLVSWVLALIFGMLVPDRLDGRTVSAAASLFGEDFIGLSAGFGNTFGILTFCFAFAALFCAISVLRRSRRWAAGISEDDVEAAEREASGYEFLD